LPAAWRSAASSIRLGICTDDGGQVDVHRCFDGPFEMLGWAGGELTAASADRVMLGQYGDAATAGQRPDVLTALPWLGHDANGDRHVAWVDMVDGRDESWPTCGGCRHRDSGSSRAGPGGSSSYRDPLPWDEIRCQLAQGGLRHRDHSSHR